MALCAQLLRVIAFANPPDPNANRGSGSTESQLGSRWAARGPKRSARRQPPSAGPGRSRALRGLDV